MKKIFLITTIIFALSYAVTANASITGFKSGNVVSVPDLKKDAIITQYDINGRLVGADLVLSQKTISINDGAVSFNVCYMDNSGVKKLVLEDEQKTDTIIENITPSPTPSPSDNTYPSIYEKEKDAIFTIAVVNELSYVEHDGESAVRLDVLTRGREESITVSSDILVEYVPDYLSQLVGSSASILKKGDIIFINTTPRGTINKLALVFRPVDDNLVMSDKNYGNSFERLFSSGNAVYGGAKIGTFVDFRAGVKSSPEYQYVFGVITGKGNDYFTLHSKDGKYSIDISPEDETIVYVCDVNEKKQLSIEKTGSIAKSSFPKSIINDDDTIDFTDEYLYNYAFVKIADGTVTEVVVYKDYE